MHQLSSILDFFLLSGLMGGPTHLARGLLGRHGLPKPYPGRAWAYKVARGPVRHVNMVGPMQDGPNQAGPRHAWAGPGRLFGHLIFGREHRKIDIATPQKTAMIKN
jgi:hypothetical protein